MSVNAVNLFHGFEVHKTPEDTLDLRDFSPFEREEKIEKLEISLPKIITLSGGINKRESQLLASYVDQRSEVKVYFDDLQGAYDFGEDFLDYPEMHNFTTELEKRALWINEFCNEHLLRPANNFDRALLRILRGKFYFIFEMFSESIEDLEAAYCCLGKSRQFQMESVKVLLEIYYQSEKIENLQRCMHLAEEYLNFMRETSRTDEEKTEQASNVMNLVLQKFEQLQSSGVVDEKENAVFMLRMSKILPGLDLKIIEEQFSERTGISIFEDDEKYRIFPRLQITEEGVKNLVRFFKKTGGKVSKLNLKDSFVVISDSCLLNLLKKLPQTNVSSISLNLLPLQIPRKAWFDLALLFNKKAIILSLDQPLDVWSLGNYILYPTSMSAPPAPEVAITWVKNLVQAAIKKTEGSMECKEWLYLLSGLANEKLNFLEEAKENFQHPLKHTFLEREEESILQECKVGLERVEKKIASNSINLESEEQAKTTQSRPKENKKDLNHQIFRKSLKVAKSHT